MRRQDGELMPTATASDNGNWLQKKINKVSLIPGAVLENVAVIWLARSQILVKTDCHWIWSTTSTSSKYKENKQKVTENDRNMYKYVRETWLTGAAVVFRSFFVLLCGLLVKNSSSVYAVLPGLCSSEGVEELQETNRMSVGGQMRGGKSDEEVCVCACVWVY